AEEPPVADVLPDPSAVTAPASEEFPAPVERPALLAAEPKNAEAEMNDALPAAEEAPPAQEQAHQAGEAAAELATDFAEEVIGATRPAPNGADSDGDDDEAAEDIVESVGGADALEEVPDRAPRYRRQYKIQEVIKRRQVMLVQVVKEERGTKGAALTT